jgi:hypothetical protein
MPPIHGTIRAAKQVMLLHRLSAIVAMAARLNADSTPTLGYTIGNHVFYTVVCAVCVIHQYTT